MDITSILGRSAKTRLERPIRAHFLEARITTLATLAVPPLTLVFAFAILGDLPSARELQGGILMLVGISIPMLSSARRQEA